ncbi:metal ABC transporter solute-binding protein, Zn/Mn family [Limnobacter sp.]|uniref:metal ABC transporter solute-binding protein, Zn/Mn family n=1 Tax=Limnobacter sp. TaxID=2003368 RepID=UPI00351385B2
MAMAKANPPQLVASFSILQDIVRQVAPAHFVVHGLVPANADAHVFSPKPRDAQLLSQAKVLFFNGLGFEGWFQRFVQAAGYKGPVVQVGQAIEPRRTRKGNADPHAWQSLTHGAAYANAVAEALVQHFPSYQEEIRSRANRYTTLLLGEHDQIVKAFATLPATQRKVITAHNAFAYFGEAYGVEFFAPQGWSTHSQPSAAAVAKLITLAKQKQVKGIFLENMSDPRLVERIAKESGARVGGTLYSDALSDPQGPAPTYLQMCRHNASTLLATLSV